MRYEMGDKVRRKVTNKTGMIVAVRPSYVDVYVPSTGCVFMWPEEDTELITSANYACRCFVCGHPVRGEALVLPWGSDEETPQLVHAECVEDDSTEFPEILDAAEIERLIAAANKRFGVRIDKPYQREE